MNKPLYSVNDRLVHEVKGAACKVMSVFRSGPSYRYYVNHSGWTWSVPETGLLTEKEYELRLNEIKALQTA